MCEEEIHHWSTFTAERRTHQRSIASLVDIGSVLDHPPDHLQPRN
jgi:hypothetical protein